MMRPVVVIPAYQADETLISIVEALTCTPGIRVIVVNDGSTGIHRDMVMKLKGKENVDLLHHAVNLGKGYALRTGFNHFLLTYGDESPGIVMADSDGQHRPEDILKVLEHLEKSPDELVLGARTFGREIPLRSLIGNIITIHVFSLLLGRRLSDTQTGLRGIPRKYIPAFLQLEGDRYDFEMNMLITARQNNITISEEKIETLYDGTSQKSHFNPFLDSMKIYFLLLRFAFSSLFASIIDLTVFTICFQYIFHTVLPSFIIARIISPLLNFFINRHWVFHNRGRLAATMARYILLFLTLTALSYLSITTMVQKLGIHAVLAKIIAESVLFLASFAIQRDFVFSTAPGEREK